MFLFFPRRFFFFPAAPSNSNKKNSLSLKNNNNNNSCVKYTDKWAERDVGYGSFDKWGDKWEENFKDGTGFKKGETWSSDGRSGHSFNRWWGEDHLGGGRVRKHGHSTEGESWDNGNRKRRVFFFSLLRQRKKLNV